jgi:hypothetical protein
VAHHKKAELVEMLLVSNRAWSEIISLCLFIRKKDDEQKLNRDAMHEGTAFVVNDLSFADRDIMVRNRNVDLANPKRQSANLRTTLNKMVHYDLSLSTYRVSNKSYYLILTGPDVSTRKGPWVIEIHVQTFCKVCKAVLRVSTF